MADNNERMFYGHSSNSCKNYHVGHKTSKEELGQGPKHKTTLLGGVEDRHKHEDKDGE